MIVKIDKMHLIFGIEKDHTCKECSNLEEHYYDKKYYKCACYGTSASQSTDWKVSNIACGLFNKEYKGKRIVKMRIKEPDKPIEGQISLLGDN